MKLRTTVRPCRGPADLTPLIDVVLLLLIFFVLSSSFVSQAGLQVELPEGLEDGGVEYSSFVITLTPDPRGQGALIFFRDQLVTLERLRQELEALAREAAGTTVVLKHDRSIPSGLVWEVLAMGLKLKLRMVVSTQPGGEIR